MYVCGGEGGLVGQQERRRQAGKGSYKAQFPHASICMARQPRAQRPGGWILHPSTLNIGSKDRESC